MNSVIAVVLILVHASGVATQKPRPHIVVIIADDLGWCDVGWCSPNLPTPSLNRLASEGVLLNASYVQPSCSPSRSAFMSGRYPFHLGLQHETIVAGYPHFLPDDKPILPQTLKSLGYATHAIGKWHLGFCDWRYTPTRRGFDSFYGFYNAAEDYYNHTTKDGYDFRDNERVDFSAKDSYSTHLFADRAVKIIREHDASRPLFVYLAFQAVHGPEQVPKSYVERYCSHIPEPNRQLKCGMIAALDEAVKNVTLALQQSGLADSTLLLFTTDNGGPVNEFSSNWPLRGGKTKVWEGGTRGVAFLHAPKLLKKSGYTYNELIHFVDWYPTFVEAAGGGRVRNIDGVSQWSNLLEGSPGPRKEFIYNIDEVDQIFAIRLGPYKLIDGYPGSPDGWYVSAEMANAKSVLVSTKKVRTDYLLYNIDLDPLEKNNIVHSSPDIFKKLKARLDRYRKSLVPSVKGKFVQSANPALNNNIWSPGFC